MTPNNENLNRLEQFLAETEHQTKEEALAELASQGVDVAAFKTRISGVVRKGYQQQAKQAARSARAAASEKTNRRFGNLFNKSLEELLAIFEKIQAGDFGSGFQQAALARCRNLQNSPPSETELRSWLEDISEMDE